MDQPVSADEIKRGRSLHAMLLFDFIVIHIFLFVVALGMIKTSYTPLVLMPIISISLLTFVLFRAAQAKKSESSWFVRAHMQLAAKRAKLFLTLFLVTGTFTSTLVFLGQQFGMSKITSYSLAFGVGQLPFMVALLVLIVMEYDAEHQAKTGKVPSAAAKLCPPSEEKN